MAEVEPAGIGRRQFVQAGAVTGAALLGGGSLVMAAEASDPAMTPGMTADEVVKLLDLQPNATCGFVRVTFLSPLTIAPGGLPVPFANGRPLGSALYFLVTPTAPVRMHRIRNGQLYHYYLGDPLEVFMLHDDGTTEHVVVGPDLRSGQKVQLHIPGNTFHTARLVGEGAWFLGGSTEWPGVVPAEDIEIGDLDALAAKYPSVASDMRAIAASVRDVVAPGGPRQALLRAASRLASLACVVILLSSPWAAASDAGSGLTTVNPASAYPEGPTVVDGVLYYAEMGNDRVMRFDGAANTVVWARDGCGPTTVAPLGDGSLAVLCHREEIVARISAEGALLGIVDRDREGRPFTNPNAGVSDGKGGIYFSSSGTFSPGARATGAVLHLDATGTLTRVAEGIHYANGVAVSPDGAALYVSEHLGRRVLAFDIAGDGTLSGRRTFVALDDLVGADPERGWEVGPDGLTIDRDGNLIIAEYGAGHLLVVDRDAKLVTTIAVPERYVTASAFDAGQTRLYITAPASLMDPSLGAVYATPYSVPGIAQ